MFKFKKKLIIIKKKIEYKAFLNSIKNIEVFYTYAHCEEIARMQNMEERLNLLNYFKEITKNNEILYTAFLDGDWINNKFYFFKEDIEKCMDRTEQSLEYNKTIYTGLEEDDAFHKETRKKTENINFKENLFLEYNSDFLKYLEEYKVMIKNSRECLEEDLEKFLETLYLRGYNDTKDILILKTFLREREDYPTRLKLLNHLISLCHKKISFSNFQAELKKNLLLFTDTEFLIELLMKFIYTKKIATDKNAISKFFDVTHIILASQCDLFVSGDKKLIKKCEMIYNFLGISTKAVYLENIRENLFEKLNKLLKEN